MPAAKPAVFQLQETVVVAPAAKLAMVVVQAVAALALAVTIMLDAETVPWFWTVTAMETMSPTMALVVEGTTLVTARSTTLRVTVPSVNVLSAVSVSPV